MMWRPTSPEIAALGLGRRAGPPAGEAADRSNGAAHTEKDVQAATLQAAAAPSKAASPDDLPQTCYVDGLLSPSYRRRRLRYYLGGVVCDPYLSPI